MAKIVNFVLCVFATIKKIGKKICQNEYSGRQRNNKNK